MTGNKRMHEEDTLLDAANGAYSNNCIINKPFQHYTEYHSLLKLNAHVTLHPHQQSALMWMLGREQYNSFIKNSQKLSESIRGGVLADGPGLGKTLTVLSCIHLHRPVVQSTKPVKRVKREKYQTNNSPKKTTLIIVPNVMIIQQWVKEIRLHFQDNTFTSTVYSRNQSCEEITANDIVFITIQELTKEWHFLQSQLSERGKHISKLFNIEWWRICVDEVQEIEGLASTAGKMAKELNATIRWGISATPISKLQDIQGISFT